MASRHDDHRRLGDFTTNPRVLVIGAVAVVVAIASVVAGIALLDLIRLVTNIAYFGRFSFAEADLTTAHLSAATVFIPVAGALIIGLMARFGSEKIRGHGIPEAIEAILLGRSRLDAKVAVLKPLSSAIAIGTGGPFGAEGPIIMTGGAIGSLIAQALPVSDSERKTLLVAGAAAGMTTVFGTPIAAIMLAVELLLFEWSPRSFIPVAVAAIVAEVARTALHMPSPLFPFHGETSITALGLGGWIVIGIAAALLSSALTQLVYACEDGFLKLPIHWMWWPMIGGVVIGLGGLIEPNALGVGYHNIAHMLEGQTIAKAAIVLLLVKAVIWSVALGSGTSGGVLAPLLIMGASLGGLEALVFPSGGAGFWPLVSMAAILGGTMRSPLTGVVFALELTHDWGMALPLLIAVPMAYGFTVLALKRSILTEKVSRRGFHLSREYTTDPLEILFVREVMRTNLVALPASLTRATLLAALDGEHKIRPLFFVVDEAQKLVGVVTRSQLETWAIGSEDDHRTTLGEVAQKAVVADADEPLRAAVSRMAQTGRTWLPVVSHDDTRAIVGEITLEDSLKARVRHLEEEQRRERVLPLKIVLPAWLRRS
jgi:H+/Cl- antiporter ClcA/CBS domain-containing protein